MARVVKLVLDDDLDQKLDRVVAVYGKQSAATGGTVHRTSVIRALIERAYETVTKEPK